MLSQQAHLVKKSPLKGGEEGLEPSSQKSDICTPPPPPEHPENGYLHVDAIT